MSSDPGACITMLPENALDSLNDQLHTSINDCLDVLLNQDRSLKDLTLRALQLVEDVKAKVGEANALFIDGVRLFNRPSNPFNYFSEAEDMGCTHSALYYFMGECYRDGDMGVKGDASMAIEYYTKAIAGMSIDSLSSPLYLLLVLLVSLPYLVSPFLVLLYLYA